MADEELASYRLQFQQVEAALLGDPDNEELKKLKADLEEVIALQEELASTAASGSVQDSAPVSAPVKKYEVGDRVMAPLPNGNRAVAVVDSLTAAGVAVIFISSGQKTIVDPSDLSAAPDSGKKHYVFDTTRNSLSKTAANKKEWLAERERRRMRAQKKEMKRKELDSAKESEKNNWLKFNSKAVTKGIKGMKRVIATGSAQDGPVGGMKSQTMVSSRANQFAFKSARGSMDSLF
ncbi:unnamed protein product [Nippostrongylus brasiliensis]|uniref:Survival of motor neuron-related-splicing factor 30 (inferred by orthology to a human protein) n=1 Tax=Nippostrongylus brasiliensis TaxID=27835 RepID=A0A0N4XEV2_NIPBR|nr:hypothetical protein Q1695_014053 [Nippostrongylus brasiliensis]VDL64272.1 unnamed protein product [Nippostrongylus brasiliensis]